MTGHMRRTQMAESQRRNGAMSDEHGRPTRREGCAKDNEARRVAHAMRSYKVKWRTRRQALEVRARGGGVVVRTIATRRC